MHGRVHFPARPSSITAARGWGVTVEGLRLATASWDPHEKGRSFILHRLWRLHFWMFPCSFGCHGVLGSPALLEIFEFHHDALQMHPLNYRIEPVPVKPPGYIWEMLTDCLPIISGLWVEIAVILQEVSYFNISWLYRWPHPSHLVICALKWDQLVTSPLSQQATPHRMQSSSI